MTTTERMAGNAWSVACTGDALQGETFIVHGLPELAARLLFKALQGMHGVDEVQLRKRTDILEETWEK